ncbi:hypothetical protein CHS0354_031292 [Potamilus streckersoni]|uniref:Acyl-ACP thioesterase n=1 Tax=Potamilus streckersoni TaxID=2493646 RepID=A0AAE0TDB6_9BIVA|nr:hypothetical protein CHS0354_031292 [Potamilus streckersoni]
MSEYQPDRLIKSRVSEDRSSGEVILPGLWYTDFDRKIGGKWTLWSIAKTFEAVRYALFFNGFINYYALREENHSIFMAGTLYEMFPAIHKLNAKKHWGPLYPIRATMCVSHAGDTSLTLDIVIYDCTTKEKLASCLTKFVYVNLLTRKAVLLPPWIYKMTINVDESSPRTISKPQQLKIPSDCFQFTVCSLFSDTDNNGHVNHSTYVRWCSDAASVAATTGNYSNFKMEIGSYSLERLEVYYIGELVVGDEAVVNTWQDDSDFRKLYFAITKDSRRIFNAQFVYLNDIPSADIPGFKSKI